MTKLLVKFHVIAAIYKSEMRQKKWIKQKFERLRIRTSLCFKYSNMFLKIAKVTLLIVTNKDIDKSY